MCWRSCYRRVIKSKPFVNSIFDEGLGLNENNEDISCAVVKPFFIFICYRLVMVITAWDSTFPGSRSYLAVFLGAVINRISFLLVSWRYIVYLHFHIILSPISSSGTI